TAQAGGAGGPAAAGGFRDPDGAAYARHGGVLQSGAVREDETVGVLHQYRARHDDPLERPGGRAEREGNRGGRTGCVRDRAAAGRASAVDDAERSADAAHGWAWAVFERPAVRHHGGELPAVRGGEGV